MTLVERMEAVVARLEALADDPSRDGLRLLFDWSVAVLLDDDRVKLHSRDLGGPPQRLHHPGDDCRVLTMDDYRDLRGNPPVIG